MHVVPVAFIVTIFRDEQIEGRLSAFEAEPRAVASLPFTLVSSPATVAAVLPSAPTFLLKI